MSKPYLEVTYRDGKPFAAYLYLDRRPGDKSTRAVRDAHWLIDFAPDGRAIGIEFTHIGSIDISALNRTLSELHQPAISRSDLLPLQAA